MTLRYDLPFYPVPSTAPSFLATLSTVSSAQAMESTSVRDWQGPTGRSVRLSETSGVDYNVQIGTSDVVVTSTASMLILGGVVEVFRVNPGQTHIALMTQSTQISNVNITLGYGR